MTEIEGNTETPALLVEELIKEYDSYLMDAGVQTTIITAAEEPGKKKTILGEFINSVQNESFRKLSVRYVDIIELTAEIVAIVDDEPYFSSIDLPEIPEIDHDNVTSLKNIYRYIVSIKNSLKPLVENEIKFNKASQFQLAIKNKKKILNKGFFYEFTDGDLKRIQALINELRDQISLSEMFELNHQQRLLRRLESIQSELHKKMSDVDKLWGLVGDAGVVIGKFGKNSKPFVDRIKELSQITWRTQARAEELPSGIHNPLIESDD